MRTPDSKMPALCLSAALALTAVAPLQAADNYAMGVCELADQSDGVQIRPTYAADTYLDSYHSKDPRYKIFSFNKESVVTLSIYPRHGKLIFDRIVPEEEAKKRNWFRYQPNEGYIGRDHFEILIEKDGIKVRLNYLIEGQKEWGEKKSGIDVCVPEHWKISKSPVQTRLGKLREPSKSLTRA